MCAVPVATTGPLAVPAPVEVWLPWNTVTVTSAALLRAIHTLTDSVSTLRSKGPASTKGKAMMILAFRLGAT